MPAAQRYRRDEQLTWTRIEGEVPTKRLVTFEEYHAGGGSAIVHFGHSIDTGQPQRHTVPLDQLSRPQPSNLPEWYTPIQTPKAPPPPSEDEVNHAITRRREALAEALDRARQAWEAVASATQLAKRSQDEYDSAKAALATLDRHSKAAELAAEQAIRDGQPIPEHRNGVDRQYVIDRVSMTSGPRDRLAAELADAIRILTDAVVAVKKAAILVLGALLDRDVEQLRQLEEVALQARADILSVAGHWISAADGPVPMSQASAALLSAAPDYDRVKLLSSTEAAVAPWRAMLERLVSGDAEADFRSGSGG